jgi:hypothetical protein
MAFRELAVTEIREVLRARLSGTGLRKVAAQAGVDRKTARRYVQTALQAGLTRDGGVAQLGDELLGQVAGRVRPGRPGGHAERCGFGRTAATARIADGKPGAECQLGFGYMGMVADPAAERRRKAHALIFTTVSWDGEIKARLQMEWMRIGSRLRRRVLKSMNGQH